MSAQKANKHSGMSNKEMRRFFEKLDRAPGFPIDLDLQKINYTLTGHGSGGKKPENDRVSILIYGSVANYGYPLAAIRFTREEWEEFKTCGNELLNIHRRTDKKRKKNRKKK